MKSSRARFLDHLAATLTRPTEKLWVKVDAAFGWDAWRPAKIVRAIYGLKSSGARFQDHLAATLRSLYHQGLKTSGYAKRTVRSTGSMSFATYLGANVKKWYMPGSTCPRFPQRLRRARVLAPRLTCGTVKLYCPFLERKAYFRTWDLVYCVSTACGRISDIHE